MTTPVDAPPAAAFLAVDEAPGLEVLEAGDGPGARREVAGLALPYGEVLNREHFASGARRQMFAKGSAKVRDSASLYFGHDHLNRGTPIGRLVESEQTDAGLRVRARFWDTPKADEVYALAKPDEDGRAVLDRFSVGYFEVKGHLEEDGDLYVHDEVDVFEDSLVDLPAYDTAGVDTVLGARITPTTRTHERPAPMTDTLELTPELLSRLEGAASSEDMQSLSSSITDLERRIATLGTGAGDGDAVEVPGSSYGEFLQMLAANDKAAVDFLAYVGGNTADLGEVLKDSWVGERFRIVEKQRTVLNLFGKSPLPATGMGIEYGVEGTDTTQVGKQANEGDVLPYGKITFATDRAPLETYGGWGEMTRQEIERSPFNVVERFFNALLNRYAATTEAAVETALTTGGTALAGGVLDMATSDGWTRFVIRAAKALKDTGYPIEGLAVSWDVFEDVALMRDGVANDAPRLLDRDTGSLNIKGLNGQMFSLPVVPFTPSGGAVDVIRAFNGEAIRTYEAGGAPFRLQDDDITNLTKAFSIYGYLAVAPEIPGAIVKPATV